MYLFEPLALAFCRHCRPTDYNNSFTFSCFKWLLLMLWFKAPPPKKKIYQKKIGDGSSLQM